MKTKLFRRFAVLAMVILFAVPLFSQNVIYTIATRGTKVGKPTKIGDFVYITADLTLYQLKKAFSRDITGTLILASGANYAVANSTWVSGAVAGSTGTFSSTLNVTGTTTLGTVNATTGTVTTLGSTTGTITTLSSTSATVGTTLTLPGGKTITKTSGNENSATTSGSLVVGNGNDTLTATKIIATGAVALGSTLGVTGATTVTGGLIGTAITRGSGNFTTTATRVAIAITGATSSDYYIVRGIATDQYTRPVAGDLLNCFAKTDSLIVMRAAGTTSGMGFTYFRIK